MKGKGVFSGEGFWVQSRSDLAIRIVCINIGNWSKESCESIAYLMDAKK